MRSLLGVIIIGVGLFINEACFDLLKRLGQGSGYIGAAVLFAALVATLCCTAFGAYLILSSRKPATPAPEETPGEEPLHPSDHINDR